MLIVIHKYSPFFSSLDAEVVSFVVMVPFSENDMWRIPKYPDPRLPHAYLHTSIHLPDVLSTLAPGEFNILIDVKYIYSLQQYYQLDNSHHKLVRDTEQSNWEKLLNFLLAINVKHLTEGVCLIHSFIHSFNK